MAACAEVSAEELRSLREDGYVVIRGVVGETQCDAVREHVSLCIEEAVKQGRRDLFGDIQEADRRCDLKLDLCAPVLEALNSFAQRCGALLSEVVGGGAQLVELAAITSENGAEDQRVHADTVHGVTRFLQSDLCLGAPGDLSLGPQDEQEKEEADDDIGQIARAVATDTALIFTALVALQDIDEDMGPTHVWPRTHTVEHHAALLSASAAGRLRVVQADGLFGVPHRKMLLRRGDLVLYDSRTMHCGGANSSERKRSVLCVSVMGPGLRPDGSTWTMLPSLRNMYQLSDFPLSADAVRAPTATRSASGDVVVVLPPASAAAPAGDSAGARPEGQATSAELRAVPPLEEWAAAVQCVCCGRWRPCSVAEAADFTAAEGGFRCSSAGFACSQEQRFTTEEIDAMFS